MNNVKQLGVTWNEIYERFYNYIDCRLLEQHEYNAYFDNVNDTVGGNCIL